ncbi:hypothetical protein TRICI_000592 [Trichomonascus ciferrii]|uniref:Dienelactone hydrolase domain-containing protein n=1 Tax=Trichomonascus ciferrii TaxID=44093 RepID=A0A642VD02_9ASCO|nr:hypothetical protein TRICI_000592 [Trichomonascus ciferrii]
MASRSFANCCSQGFKYTGEASGTMKTYGGYECYVSGPDASDKVVLLITDIFGHSFINNQLLADEFAKAGYLTVVPDLFQKDPAPLNPPGGMQELMTNWLPNHGVEVSKPICDKVLEAIKAELKPKFIGAAGYCYGAKHAVMYSGTKTVDSIAIAHPSMITEDEVKAIKTPICISAAETDPVYDDDMRVKSENILKDIGATYFLTRTSGVSHGFAVRGDPNDRMQAFARKKCCLDFIDWFDFTNQ